MGRKHSDDHARNGKSRKRQKTSNNGSNQQQQVDWRPGYGLPPLPPPPAVSASPATNLQQQPMDWRTGYGLPPDQPAPPTNSPLSSLASSPASSPSSSPLSTPLSTPPSSPPWSLPSSPPGSPPGRPRASPRANTPLTSPPPTGPRTPTTPPVPDFDALSEQLTASQAETERLNLENQVQREELANLKKRNADLKQDIQDLDPPALSTRAAMKKKDAEKKDAEEPRGRKRKFEDDDE